MQCLPTSTGTTLPSKASPSNLTTKLLPPSYAFFVQSYELMYGFLAICRFFKESSEEEREHAEKLMKYQVFFFFGLSPSLIPSSSR
jgi:hypothetical protein